MGKNRHKASSSKSQPELTSQQKKPSERSPTQLNRISKFGLKMLVAVLFCILLRVFYAFSSLPGATDSLKPLENQFNQSVDHGWIQQKSITEFSPSIQLMPTVFVGVLVRNKAHSLPYFLRGLEIQDYPMDRLQLLFILDNTLDESQSILQTWINKMQTAYHDVILEIGVEKLKQQQMWNEEHQRHVIRLRQKLLEHARHSWADFYLSIDADVVLMNSKTLSHLVAVSLSPSESMPRLDHSLSIVSPLLNCTSSEYYANFWGAMTEEGYYKRSENYFALQRRHVMGLYPVAMVHTVFLVNLRHWKTQQLAYDPPPPGYVGPADDIILFARSAQFNEVKFYLDNTQFFGYIPSPVEADQLDASDNLLEQWLKKERDTFTHLRLQAVIDLEDEARVIPSNHLMSFAQSQLPVRSKLGLDEIYYINLLRRPDRRKKMEYFLDQLGIDARHVEAVDGKELTTVQIKKMGIVQLKGYADPYHKRSLKLGEIGCFLSHYNIWKEMIDRGYNTILILEDDVRFMEGFVERLKQVLEEAERTVPNWDLLYIGRKRMSKNEKRVANSRYLAHPDYTYWTLGYLLRRTGAEKLIAQDPLKKLVAVDEFLPIMFNRHPRNEWLEQFEPRNLIALSAEPLLLEPQRYTGETNYVSDTEDSAILGTS